MAEPGFELLIGSYRDGFFGPVITLGAGGTYAELVRDYSLRVAPITENEADEMMNELRIDRILKGYRGRSPYDTGGLKDVIVKVSKVMLENPCINQIETNPFSVLTSGGAVIDAKVLLGSKR